MHSYEYIQFINENIMQYLPSARTQIGNKINFRCPICGDSQKSQTKKRGWYYLKNATYYCYNCSTYLTGMQLLKALSGSDYDELYRQYMQLFLKNGFNSLSANIYDNDENELNIFKFQNVIDDKSRNALSDKAREYLEKRLVLKAPFLKEPLYSVYSKDKTREYILIPWRINNIDAYYQINDFQKNSQMKYIFPKNKRKILYGLDNIDPTYQKIIVFEGVYDSLFVKNGIACGTKAISDYQFKLIKKRWPQHQICISFDNDQSGMQAMAKVLQKHEYDENYAGIKFFIWFDSSTSAKDINEQILQKNDVDIFSKPEQIEPLLKDKLQMKLFLSMRQQ